MDFNPHIDAIFRIHGKAAVYEPEVGESLEVSIVPNQSDETDGLSGSQFIANAILFDVRRSEVAEPKEGDRVLWDGCTYTILSDPVSRDSDRLIWTLSVQEG